MFLFPRHKLLKVTSPKFGTAGGELNGCAARLLYIRGTFDVHNVGCGCEAGHELLYSCIPCALATATARLIVFVSCTKHEQLSVQQNIVRMNATDKFENGAALLLRTRGRHRCQKVDCSARQSLLLDAVRCLSTASPDQTRCCGNGR